MKTIVFDLDGTLLDSRDRHTTLLRDICRERSLAITDEQLRDYLPSKLGGLNTYRYLAERCGFSPDEAKQCALLWGERIEHWEYLLQDKLYADAVSTLDELRVSWRCQLVLVTARQREDLLMRQLEKLDIREAFTQIFCVSPKQAKECKVQVAQALQNLICWVGDTEIDQYAAQCLHCSFYALDRGFRSHAFWIVEGVTPHPDLSMLNYSLEP